MTLALPNAGRSKLHWLALAVVLSVSVLYELFFIERGVNRLDESWQLYTAMRLHAGGTLYEDALWVFPPGHVWTAWFAWWLDPPGLVFARVVYAAFSVALAGAIYLSSRRLMPEPFALLAALLVAMAAPRGHAYHLLFGYRYLVIPVLALLAFDRRLQGGPARWMVVSGALMGVALTFRLTPAFSASCGIAVALVAHHPRWRDWLGDGLRFSAGLVAAVAPVLLWFSLTVGLPRFWHEVVVHPLLMLQALPAPVDPFPEVWHRGLITKWFVSIQFQAIWYLYAGYLVGLAALWIRSRREGDRFGHGLLLAWTIFGAVFFVRSTGRSDEPHLDSVIPPVCVLFAHLVSGVFARAWPRGSARSPMRPLGAGALAVGVLAAWVFLLDTDRVVLRPAATRPLESLGGRIGGSPKREAWAIDRTVELIRMHTEPDDILLNLSPTPLFHILSGRQGPGYFDIIMPGTFPDAGMERWFLERLQANPPAAIVWPRRLFDNMPERSIWQTAPLISRWVFQNYVRADGRQHTYIVAVPRAPGDPTPPSQGEVPQLAPPGPR